MLGVFLLKIQRRTSFLPVSDLILKKSAPHRAISTEQYQHRNNQTEGSTYYSPPGFFFCQQTILPNSSKGAGAACCAFWRAESGMLTLRAIMAGQYRLVLAVSTGIRAQGRVLWPSTLQTGQNRAKPESGKSPPPKKCQRVHAPGAGIPTLVTARGSWQTNVSTLLIKGR